MAAVEITAFGGPEGPAGRWARTPSEIEEHLGAVAQLVAGMALAGRAARDLTPGERYALGLRAAARWSLGITVRTPLTDDAAAPDRGRVVTELAVAEYLIAGGGPDAGPAAGVRAWLTWLTGESELLVFPCG